MEAEIAQGQLGSIGKYDVAFKGGCLVAEVEAAAGPGSAGMILKLDAGKVMDALATAIPGVIDDAVIGVIKAALLK